MSSYIPFDEREVCLNCPRKHCILEARKSAKCSILRKKRDEHRREQGQKRREKA